MIKKYRFRILEERGKFYPQYALWLLSFWPFEMWHTIDPYQDSYSTILGKGFLSLNEAHEALRKYKEKELDEPKPKITKIKL